MSPWLVSMKSPANRGPDAGTISLESGSVSMSCTVLPKLGDNQFAVG
jgi:hypothetical protein